MHVCAYAYAYVYAYTFVYVYVYVYMLAWWQFKYVWLQGYVPWRKTFESHKSNYVAQSFKIDDNLGMSIVRIFSVKKDLWKAQKQPMMQLIYNNHTATPFIMKVAVDK